jgi:hypothetical protein
MAVVIRSWPFDDEEGRVLALAPSRAKNFEIIELINLPSRDVVAEKFPVAI